VKNANPVSRYGRWISVLLLTFLLGGCGQSEPVVPPAPKTAADWFTIKVDGQSVRMQLAVMRTEMEYGLMERRELGRDDGMLFVYLRPQLMSFWMRNTPLPLDIGFFSPEGELREIYQMHPFDETKVSSRSNQLQFALEMNQGWFKANNVRPGAKLDLKAVVAALKERDFAARQFGLE
jgi:uncharacterized protein